MTTDHSCPVSNETYFEEEELYDNENDQVNDLHNYYMSQFNLEVENGKNKSKVNAVANQVTNQGNCGFETIGNWNANMPSCNFESYDLQTIDEVIDNNCNEPNIKDVLFELDGIEFGENTESSNSNISDPNVKLNLEPSCFDSNCEYIDDESLIDELCREDNEPYRLTPDIFNDTYLSSITNDKSLLPSIETAFSKHYNSYAQIDQPFTQISNDYNRNETIVHNNDEKMVNSVENYSYPNNVIYNINNNKQYVLPDTPTSCSEFTFEKSRTVSTSESIESDVNSFYDENSEGLDDDELFINLDEFGLTFDNELEYSSNEIRSKFSENEKKADKEKNKGERTCLWEHCYERYPNQHSLVEHIERSHVNTYKGDEFSCLWDACARSRRPFNARYKLLIHMRVHSGHKPNRCHHPGCGKAFSRLENLKIHVRSHTGERPYACPAPHCRKAFSNSSDRAKHQRTHFNARPYACGAEGCGKRYTDPSSLRKHVKSHPHVANVPRTCIPPAPMFKKTQVFEQIVPSSPAKLATLRCIRNKLVTVPRFQAI